MKQCAAKHYAHAAGGSQNKTFYKNTLLMSKIMCFFLRMGWAAFLSSCKLNLKNTNDYMEVRKGAVWDERLK